ncbi:hypothetical protein [Tenacibaculum ovolyticum]|uniref:hypothetical protein n=1 Tax=Tenacibaculum ovolyticum TaxID=104270 RepID=UPI001F2F6D78|nr:hypothetical protein [Tenacibaculum ovolyticum]
MNKILPFIFLPFMFLSCISNNYKKQKTEKTNNFKKIETSTKSEKIKAETEHKTATQKEVTVVVKNKHDYSENFIKGLKKIVGFGDFELTDNFLILKDKDTVEFPDKPKINKQIVLTAEKDNLAITLKIKRINQVSIEYIIDMAQFGKSTFKSNGIAEISPGFFLGSESDTDNATDISYFSTSYENVNNKCFTYIRLGTQEESPLLLGKLIKNCNDQIKEINLENFPTLREK